MEIVPGMRAGGLAGMLGRVISELEEDGYVVPPPRILNAADYGVPQDRRRLFLLASRADVAALTYPEPTVSPVGKRGEPLEANGRPAGPTVWDAIGDLP